MEYKVEVLAVNRTGDGSLSGEATVAPPKLVAAEVGVGTIPLTDISVDGTLTSQTLAATGRCGDVASAT